MFYFVNAIFVNLSILKYRELFEQHYGREACYSVSFVDGAACWRCAVPYTNTISSSAVVVFCQIRGAAGSGASVPASRDSARHCSGRKRAGHPQPHGACV